MPPARVIILGPESPFGSERPVDLTDGSKSNRVLHWTIDTFTKALEDPEIYLVGNCQVDGFDKGSEVRHRGTTRREYSESGERPGSDLFDTNRTVYLCYANVVFACDLVQDLEKAPGKVATVVNPGRRANSEVTDGGHLGHLPIKEDNPGESDQWSERAPSDLLDDVSTGLLKLEPEAVREVKNRIESGDLSTDSDLSDLCEVLTAAGHDLTLVDDRGDSAELGPTDELADFVLDTKANTLRYLSPLLTEAETEDQFSFRVREWEADHEGVLQAIREELGEGAVIVRSSAVTEDGWERSNAGQFESVLDVPASDEAQLSEAIARVIDSFDDNPANQVLIQPMLTDVLHSGVVMTRTLDHDGPYYVINYDEFTSTTDSVTSGNGDGLQTIFVRKDTLADGTGNESATRPSPDRRAISSVGLLEAVEEIEEIIGHDRLDIEFAVDESETIHILQVRPITTESGGYDTSDKEVVEAVDAARDHFVESQTPPPQVLGDRTVYGVMPDWNPAEIIGRRPRLLADSLYRYLVTDDIWARQRAEYGYRDVRPHPLMMSFCGQPYIDVRAVFNSFIPSSVPDDLAERLVSHYLDRLVENPSLHDKVEFRIAITCLTFDFDHRATPLIEANFSEDDLSQLKDGLREISREALSRTPSDLDRVETMNDRFDSLVDADLAPLRKARLLLSDCREYGTITFAHLARSAFVAVSMLRSLKRKTILTESQVSEFHQSLDTVAREFEADARSVSRGRLDWDDFVSKYGHLRPGTYDITSPTYASDPETYLRPVVENAREHPPTEDPIQSWSSDTKRTIEAELEAIGLPADVEQFVQFLTDAIEGREYAKFVFSRNLSAALEELSAFGSDHGLTRAEISHIPIQDFFRISGNDVPADTADWLAERSKEGQRQYAITNTVELPSLICDASDFDSFERPPRSPNFVTDHRVTAEVVELDQIDIGSTSLEDRIVMIPQADPGYDWLFGHDIAGLITKYGGTNSHMAIRAAEFSIPAAIGVGEELYQDLMRAEMLRLDCSGMTITEV